MYHTIKKLNETTVFVLINEIKLTCSLRQVQGFYYFVDYKYNVQCVTSLNTTVSK